MEKKQESELDNGIEDIANDVDELTEDIDDIGKDTDAILKRVDKQQQTLLESLNKIGEAIKSSKENKWWIICLFLFDKCVMAGLILWLGK